MCQGWVVVHDRHDLSALPMVGLLKGVRLYPSSLSKTCARIAEWDACLSFSIEVTNSCKGRKLNDWQLACLPVRNPVSCTPSSLPLPGCICMVSLHNVLMTACVCNRMQWGVRAALHTHGHEFV
eukprot:799554-Pelagomonas_calceolata.AAC.2